MQFIEGIDIPEEVLQAHSDGKLVLFVGAGASKSAPASLPLFDELAHQLGDLARVPFEDGYRDTIDAYIGSLPSGFDAHRHAADLLQPEGSAPNDLHRSLVKLAASAPAIRIVTTNFDNHLSVAAAELGIDLGRKWIGPALPLGRDFEGVVHLHGSLTRHHRELILDDRDFGRAYFGDGWAPRFLQPMFEEYVVLFVGYSLTDTVMRYLTLGLPSKTSRYALVAEKEAAVGVLRRLQVTAIPYPNDDATHAVLPQVLDSWARWKSMGQGEHKERIKSLISARELESSVDVEAPLQELSVVDEDYLLAQISTAEGARIFADTATTVNWLEWADRSPHFQCIFNPTNELSEASSVLADWFVRRFVGVPHLSGAAMASLQRHGQTMSPALIRKLIFALKELEEQEPEAAQKWQVILMTSIQGYSAPPQVDSLFYLSISEQPPHAAIIRGALTPFLKLSSRAFRLWQSKNDWPPAELSWPLKAHPMKKYIGAWVRAQVKTPEVALTILESALLSGYEMLHAYDGAAARWALELRRPAIESHSQNRHLEPIDVIVNELRDLGVRAQRMSPPLYERWWEYGYGLFQRLALHLVATSSALSSDAKIEWVLDRNLLFELSTKHETFQVLKVAVPLATTQVRERLLERVLAGRTANSEANDRESSRTYETYNLLVWLKRAAPSWEQVTAEVARFEAETDYAERKHPDLIMWHEPMRGVAKPVAPIAEFTQQVAIDPVAALESFNEQYSGQSRSDLDPFSEEFTLLYEMAAEYPSKSLSFWDAVAASEMASERQKAIQGVLVSGWAGAELEEDTEDEILGRVSESLGNPDNLRAVTKFLLEQSRLRANESDSKFLEGARTLALSVWEENQQSFQSDLGMQPSELALNTWPGDLVHFWVTQIQRRWRAAGEEWSGLNKQESEALEKLLEGPAVTLQAIWPAVAGQLYFFDAADPAFTDKHLLPLFADQSSLYQVWESFLYHPRVSLRLLRAGFLEALVENFDRLSSLDRRELEGQFISLAASIVATAPLDNHERQKILDAAVIAENGIHAANFAAQVVEHLLADTSYAQNAWKTWMREHLAQRFDGIPRNAANDELEQWAEVVPGLGDLIPEAVPLFHGRDIGFGKDQFHREIPDDTLKQHSAELIAYYIERVKHSDPGDMFVAHRVSKTVQTIQTQLGDDAAKPLLDAASKKGFFR